MCLHGARYYSKRSFLAASHNNPIRHVNHSPISQMRKSKQERLIPVQRSPYYYIQDPQSKPQDIILSSEFFSINFQCIFKVSIHLLPLLDSHIIIK